VRIITPAPAGGGTDIVLRIFADKLSQRLGQKFLVENRPGGEAVIATDYVAKSTPDGSVLLGTYDQFTINPGLQASLPYDTVKDFEPINTLAGFNMMIVAKSSFPASSTADLIALAKSKPGEIAYASIGKGSPQYLVMELFKRDTGTNLRHVPYKDRSAITSDVLAGRIPLMVSSITGVLPYLKDGTLKGIAVSGKVRSPSAPTIATLQESGISNYEYVSWCGLLAPAGTPKEIIEKLDSEIRTIAAMPDVIDKIQKLGGDMLVDTTDGFKERIRREMAQWKGLLQATP
jgi:tripartite-type tricarboxylate transporter receptor subunit TctC